MDWWFWIVLISVLNMYSDKKVEELMDIGRKSRHHRKVVRWDERNRRRRLKGLPEKECPYPRIWKACIIERKEDGYDGDPDQHPAEVVREDHEA